MSVADPVLPADSRQILHLLWYPSAPKRIVEKCAGRSLLEGWSAWQKHLASRKRPLAPPFLTGKELPLLWGWNQISEFGYRIEDLCLESDDSSPSNAPLQADGDVIEGALTQLARAYALPQLAQRLSAESWWDMVAQLHDVAQRAEHLRVDLQSEPDELVRHQLLAGELPLALRYLFPELSTLRELHEPARAAFSEALLEWTDGQGLPHGRLLSVLGPLWACWTRARWMGERLKGGPWSREAEIQYQWLVRHAIRLTDSEGRFMLRERDDSAADEIAVDGDQRAWPKELYKTAMALVGDRLDYAAAVSALPKGALGRRVTKKFVDGKLPQVSLNSEWSGVGVLASDWSRSAVRVAAAWAESPMKIELAIGAQRLLAGDWTFRTTCDGEHVALAGEWEQSCWQSDKKCDYLELGVELSHGLRLERQLLLARKEGVVFLSDVVLSADGTPRRIVHTVELPISPNATWQPEAETRDGMLVGGTQRAAVLPLALSEWRSDPRGGRLEAAHDKLMLTQETMGRALYCPLLFDLNPGRTNKDRTWRQLTVAEMLEVVPQDMAVGFRAQSANRQWLIYRSLGPAGNRTLIGQNIAGEFFAGRLRKSGKLNEWIEIEACANDEAKHE